MLNIKIVSWSLGIFTGMVSVRPVRLGNRRKEKRTYYEHSGNAGEVEKAFQTGAPHLRAKAGGLQLLPREECGLEQLDTALERLALAVPQIKKNMIEACVHVVGADGLIREREAELLRAIADTLDCPIPPFVRITESQKERIL